MSCCPRASVAARMPLIKSTGVGEKAEFVVGMGSSRLFK
jgi:hypothetical protein